MGFCRERDYPRAYLWTFKGLDAAQHLYQSLGFKMVEQHAGQQWGTRVEEQRYELIF